MSSPITFRNPAATADAILKADRKERDKLQWSKLPFADLPSDLQRLAALAVQARVTADATMADLQFALDDKVEAPTGKRLVVTLGRDAGPNTDSVLVAWASASSGGTKTISFAQFTKSA